jgi:hypothetical protein
LPLILEFADFTAAIDEAAAFRQPFLAHLRQLLAWVALELPLL